MTQIISAFTHRGSRPSQEDRYLVMSGLATDVHLMCVMDGTVGDFVAQRVKDLIVQYFKSSVSWNMLLNNPGIRGNEEIDLITKAIGETIKKCDSQILDECSQHHINYSACTLVLCLLVRGEFLITAHLGDSRAALVHKEDGYVWGEFLTADHRPDNPGERNRIEAAGGSVVYLASRGCSTSFIRGGDFKTRKEAGDQPMQLQYSRAIGGKDLKPFGLVSDPDIRVTQLTEFDKAIIIATDGLWENTTASRAATVLATAEPFGSLSAAQQLVEFSLTENSDNITAIVALLK